MASQISQIEVIFLVDIVGILFSTNKRLIQLREDCLLVTEQISVVASRRRRRETSEL